MEYGSTWYLVKWTNCLRDEIKVIENMVFIYQDIILRCLCIHRLPQMSNVLYWGQKLEFYKNGNFVLGGMLLFGSGRELSDSIWRGYTDFGILINPCAPNPEHWQKNVTQFRAEVHRPKRWWSNKQCLIRGMIYLLFCTIIIVSVNPVLPSTCCNVVLHLLK